MTESKVLKGREFIAALIEAGIVPTWTQRVKIEAFANEFVRMEYEVLAETDLLGVVPAIEDEAA